MGRTSLDNALARSPHLLPLLERVHRDLGRVIEELQPFADEQDDLRPDDPDLAFQLHILRQAARELAFMVHPEEEAFA